MIHLDRTYFIAFDALNARGNDPEPIYSTTEYRPYKWKSLAESTAMLLTEKTGTQHDVEDIGGGEWVIYKENDNAICSNASTKD